MHLMFCGLSAINPVLQTPTFSPGQTRSSMVQWLNPQSPTTTSSNPAVTPPSPGSSPFLFSPPATVVDKPPERYVVWSGMWNTVAAHTGGLTNLGRFLCSLLAKAYPDTPSIPDFMDSTYHPVSGHASPSSVANSLEDLPYMRPA